MSLEYTLTPGKLDWPQLWMAWQGPVRLSIQRTARRKIEQSAAAIRQIVKSGEVVYGVNTGFGSLAKAHIEPAALEELQRRLVLSHAAGVGDPMPDDVVRLLLLLKVNSLGRGFSGIQPATIDALVALLNHDVLPVIPAKGSVGASGDLAPLAHLAAFLLGIGKARVAGRELPAPEALKKAGLQPLTLAAKEGIALLNGTQASTALALAALFRIATLFKSALVTGAMTTDAAQGSDTPFDPRIHAVRGQPGQVEAAKALRALLADSPLRQSHIDCDRVQDPYCLRCQPQVMGACLDMIRFAAGTLRREANAVSDNPLIFAEDGVVLSGGNFHAEPVAFAADGLAIACAEIGALAERRIAMLIDANFSALPAFLVPEPGLNSGFMIAHVTAASLASENKTLAHPASIDSLPTSANQEDHVSMATFAARRLHEMADNVAHILAIEYLAASQGIDLRAPLKTSDLLERAHGLLRRDVPFWDHDREMAPDIAAARRLVDDGHLAELAPISVLQPGRKAEGGE